jgi:hypothetical protein
MTRVIFVFVWILAAGAACAADPPRMFDGAYAKLFAKPFTASASLTIKRQNWSRRLGVTIYYLDARRSLARLTGSQRDLGTVALRSGDRVYLYFPRAELLVGAPAAVGSLPLFGSDFAADDLLAFGDLAGRFNVAAETAETLSGLPARRYELKPREGKDSPYVLVKLWIARDGGAPLREEFRSADGNLLREIVVESDGRLPLPSLWRARGYGPKGGESELQFRSFDSGRPLDPELFTVAGLRKWR